MRLLHRLAATSALIAAAFCLVPAAEANPPLKNGVGLHGPMTWGRTNPERTAYQWPLYDDAEYDVPVDLLRQVKAAGFDFVRLTVDPGPMLALKGDHRDALDVRLVNLIHQIRQQDLDVLVDIAPIGMVKTYSALPMESNATGGLFPAYVEMVRRTAHVLAPLGTDHIAFEPRNEPQMGYGVLERMRWQNMMVQLYKAVRDESPKMTIVVTGGRGGSLEGLTDLNPAPFDENTLYSFHYYLPYIFTHQAVKNGGSKNSRTWPYTVGLPYPADPAGLEAAWLTVSQRIKSDPKLSDEDREEILKTARKQVEDYFNGAGTRAGIKADFDKLSAWAKANSIPANRIFMGEFSATQRGPKNDGASVDSRDRWLTDVREEAESRGFHWSYWALTGDGGEGMVLTSLTDPHVLDAHTLAALGKGAQE